MAHQLGITRDAVYKKIKQGKIQASQVGRNFASNSQTGQYISIAQFAEVLGLSRIAVYKRVKKGQIQAQRVGRNHLISVADIRNDLNQKQIIKMDEILKRKGNKDSSP